MLIELRDAERRKVGRIDLDPTERPTRVHVQGSDREVFLDWDTALDDAGHLRRCIVCSCPDLFRTKAFPQVTGFVVVLAFAGAVIGALGLATTPPILIAMVLVLVADIAILLLSRERLVCHDLAIARYHRRWDRAIAERHAPPDNAKRPGPWLPGLRWIRSANTTGGKKRSIA
jgi:hypothetical protein